VVISTLRFRACLDCSGVVKATVRNVAACSDLPPSHAAALPGPQMYRAKAALCSGADHSQSVGLQRCGTCPQRAAMAAFGPVILQHPAMAIRSRS
jgi:hypothetical protein